MKQPELVAKIVDAVKTSTNKPVTVKIRAGWDQDNVNAEEIAQILEKNGADAITVHGRTREQFYSGKADIDIIKKVKNAVKIPVIGNGDIFKPQDAKNMMDYTGCDGVMLARGVLGNPWLISSTINYIEEGRLDNQPEPKEKILMFKKHLAMLIEEIDERRAVLEMRKHAGWYIKGLKNSAQTRDKINKVIDINELYFILDEYIKQL